jgi:hypothetical protein
MEVRVRIGPPRSLMHEIHHVTEFVKQRTGVNSKTPEKRSILTRRLLRSHLAASVLIYSRPVNRRQNPPRVHFVEPIEPTRLAMLCVATTAAHLLPWRTTRYMRNTVTRLSPMRAPPASASRWAPATDPAPTVTSSLSVPDIAL